MPALTIADRTELILDGTKIGWHLDRIRAWERGERIAPVTIEMALTRVCNYACSFCYAMFQENDRQKLTWPIVSNLLEDCAEIGVKAINFTSDGESTISPYFVDAVVKGNKLGINMACGTNGYVLNERKLYEILPHMTYLRVNFSAGEPGRYAQIMGVKEEWFYRVCENIRTMMRIKRELGLEVTIGMQMVVLPEMEDQILPLARLGRDELRPDYLVLKHCSDTEDGALGVQYGKYEWLYGTLREAESYGDEEYQVKVKWSKIEAAGKRSYQRCYGPPFLLQLSGSGLCAPCGMLFNERYKRYHIGNIAQTRFRDLWASDRYWEVMNHLASSHFNAQRMCGTLCLQHKVNEFLDDYKKGYFALNEPTAPLPQHVNFI
jgi:MoaA/NifB/PqqE/SkfB family radical SAM enzyme